MDGHKDYHAKWNKSKKDKFHITCMGSNKNTDKLIYKTEIDPYTENKDPYE